MAGTPEEYVNDPTHIVPILDIHQKTGLHTPVFCRWFDIDHERASGIKVDDPNPDW